MAAQIYPLFVLWSPVQKTYAGSEDLNR